MRAPFQPYQTPSAAVAMPLCLNQISVAKGVSLEKYLS